MKNEIFIPKKCKVGFTERTDTYTKLLGYIIMFDGKTWRKENSWESWREKYITDEEFQAKKLIKFNDDREYRIRNFNKYVKCFQDKTGTSWEQNEGCEYSKLGLDAYLEKYVGNLDTYRFHISKTSTNIATLPFEFENVPTEGFVLNKKAGGYSTGWNHRSTYCRVYDPRGFEFEITIPNLLYILENTNSIKGKGLEGKFVYGWEGKDLILIPENAPEYKEMVAFTELQDMKVSRKDLILGGIYRHKDNSDYTYMGFSETYDSYGFKTGKAHWWYKNGFTTIKTNLVKKYIGINDEYASLMDKLSKETGYEKREQIFTEVTEDYLNSKLSLGYGYTEVFRKGIDGSYSKTYVQRWNEHKIYNYSNEVVGTYHKIQDSDVKYTSIQNLLTNNSLWLITTA